MSDSDIGVDPDAKRQELKDGAAKDKQRKQQTTAAVLESVKEGVEFSEQETEWVQLGDVDFEVETDIHSDVRYAFEHIDDPNPETKSRTSDLVAALPHMIVRIDDPQEGLITDAEIIADVLQAFDRELPTTKFLEHIVEPLLDPALSNMEQRVPSSFRGQERAGFRDGTQHKRR